MREGEGRKGEREGERGRESETGRKKENEVERERERETERERLFLGTYISNIMQRKGSFAKLNVESNHNTLHSPNYSKVVMVIAYMIYLSNC